MSLARSRGLRIQRRYDDDNEDDDEDEDGDAFSRIEHNKIRCVFRPLPKGADTTKHGRGAPHQPRV